LALAYFTASGLVLSLDIGAYTAAAVSGVLAVRIRSETKSITAQCFG